MFWLDRIFSSDSEIGRNRVVLSGVGRSSRHWEHSEKKSCGFEFNMRSCRASEKGMKWKNLVGIKMRQALEG